MATITLPNHDLECGCRYLGFSNSYVYCEPHSIVIKTGEDRSRAGQKNTFEAATPFQKPLRIQTKHEMSRAVTDALGMLDVDQFTAMRNGDEAEWLRLKEIKDLSLEQLKDEAGYQYHKVGRQAVEPSDRMEEMQELWPHLHPNQIALGEAMEVFMDRLTVKQQEVIRLRYWQMYSQKNAAEVMKVSKRTAQVAEESARKALWREFNKEWPEHKEVLN